MQRGPPSAIEFALPPLATLFHCLEAARGVVLAVSGGPDSTALMYLAAAWAADRREPLLSVASVDHGLRPGSADAAAEVIRQAERLGLPARVLIWAGPKPQHAIQERARNARYALLADFARDSGATHLVTAHTLDDQAETVMFRLARGSGPAGLRGMKPETDRDGLVHARPFLGIRKNVLVEACRTHNWGYDDDPANHNVAFARTRWRRLLPLLATQGLTAERLGRLAERFARGDEALHRLSLETANAAEQERSADARVFTASALVHQPEEIVLRVLANALVELTGKAQIRLERLEHLVGAIVAHAKRDEPLRQTLHHCRVILCTNDRLTVQLETTRRRGTVSGV